MEGASNRLELLEVRRVVLPVRQIAIEVLDLLLHFLEEDFADFLVDVVGWHRLEGPAVSHRSFLDDLALFLDPVVFVFDFVGCGIAAADRCRLQGRGTHGRIGKPESADILRRWRLRLLRRLADDQVLNPTARRDLDHRTHFGHDRRRGLHGFRERHAGLAGVDIGDETIDFGRIRQADRRNTHVIGQDRGLHRDGCSHFDRRLGHRLGFISRNRPIPKGFETFARHVENLLATGALGMCGFEVVLDAGDGVGQTIHLFRGRHALAPQYLDINELGHRREQIAGFAQLDHAHRAADFVEQARNRFGLVVLPSGFDEGDDVLLHLGQIGLDLFHQRIKDLAHFDLRQLHGRCAIHLGRFVIVAGTQAIDVVVQRRVHEQQRTRDVEQGALFGRLAAGNDGVEAVALFENHATRHAKPQHAERVGRAVQHFALRAQIGRIGVGGTQIEIERVLHAHQVFLDRRRDGIEQRLVAAAQRAARVFNLAIARQQRFELVDPLEFADTPVVAACVRGVIQQVLDQIARRFGLQRRFAAVRESLDLAIDAPEQQLDRLIRIDQSIAHAIQQATGNPPQAPAFIVERHAAQTIEGIHQARGGDVGTLVAQPLHQRHLVIRPQPRRDRLHFGFRQRLVRTGRAGRQRCRQIRREQHAFAQQLLATACTQVVEQRQQDDRDVLVATLQAFQIIGQLHDAAHQHFVGIVLVADGVVEQALRDPFHFFDHHGRAVQLDHAQGALHLMQVGRAEAHQAGIGRILDIRLKRLSRLLERLVELLLDPVQSGEIDFLLQTHTQPHPFRRYANVWRPPTRVSWGLANPSTSPGPRTRRPPGLSRSASASSSALRRSRAK